MFDYTKDPLQLLIELINEDNSLGLTDELVEFGLPTTTTGEDPPKNTSINVSALPGSGYTGNVDVTYDRVPTSGFVGTVDLTFQLGDAENVSDMIPEINALLNINLTENDYVDAPLPEFEGEPNEVIPVIITMDADSLVYLGSLTIQISAGEIDLASVITTTELTGFFIDPSQIVDEEEIEP